jgi:hypothetical protein
MNFHRILDIVVLIVIGVPFFGILALKIYYAISRRPAQYVIILSHIAGTAKQGIGDQQCQ